MLQRALILGSLLLLSPFALAQVKVSGAPGATLSKLSGTPTLVTVVLKGSGAEDPNLQIIETHKSGIVVLTTKGEPIPYLFDSIAEIRVQGGKIEERVVQLNTDVLPAAEQEIVDRALARALELFQAPNIVQESNMILAAILSLAEHEDADTYLAERVETNDIEVRLEANTAQYLSGGEISERLVRLGLESGARKVRGDAARLAGLGNLTATAPTLSAMMQDRTPEVSEPAMKALGRMDQRDAIPYLVSMIGSRSGDKGDAAAWALGQLGGKNLIAQLKLRLSTAEGVERFRIARVLYQLDDPMGRKLLVEIMRDVPTLQHEVALILGREEGDWDAKEILRARLQKREDVNDRNLVNRARTAGALVAGGDPQAKAVLQELLRGESAAARNEVFRQLTLIGGHRLLTLIRSSIENADPEIAILACRTAVSIGYPTYRTRLLDAWE